MGPRKTLRTEDLKRIKYIFDCRDCRTQWRETEPCRTWQTPHNYIIRLDLALDLEPMFVMSMSSPLFWCFRYQDIQILWLVLLSLWKTVRLLYAILNRWQSIVYMNDMLKLNYLSDFIKEWMCRIYLKCSNNINVNIHKNPV